MKLYSILNITNTNVSENEIKKQYYKLARKNHPDKGGDSNLFQQIQNAYEILSNIQYRKIYHETKETNITKIRQIITQKLNQHFTQPGRPEPKKINIKINLQQSYVGLKYNYKFTDTLFCNQCMGMSYINNEYCNECNNTGLKQHELISVINIRPGIMNKETIILFGEGGNTWGYKERSNIIVEINIESPRSISNIFKRKKNNLHTICNITLREALCGFKKQLVNLDGRKITIENKDVLEVGTKKIIPLLGFKEKEVKDGKEYGDLIIEFNITMPKKISNEFREACKKYLE
jgi:DnaJ-class molecular chaperone